jgi:histidinol-phosphate aminotransferase
MNIKFNNHIYKINPYVPGKPEEVLKRELGVENIIKMASNENPLGTSPKALEAIRKEINKSYFYPDDTYYKLKQKLAENHKVTTENIILGSGSVELIKMIASAVITKGDYALISKNSFLMYQKVIQEFAGEEYIIWINTTDDYAYDINGFSKALKENDNIKIIFMANPNNPTGTYIKEKELYNFLKEVPNNILIVLDEAYVEYVEANDFTSGEKWLKEFPNLILLRTMSKVYGLAGLRVGYGVGDSELISGLMKVRLPFNVSRLAAVAAEAALDDYKFLQLSFDTNKKGKKYLIKELSELGFRVISSQTNFLMFIPDIEPIKLVKELEKRGIIVRPLAAFGIKEAVRVTIGTMEQNKIFIENLKEIVKKLK